MTKETDMEPDFRPADYLFPERRAALKTGGCAFDKGDGAEHNLSFRDPLSRKEYGISGLCQTCQDKVFPPNAPDVR